MRRLSRLAVGSAVLIATAGCFGGGGTTKHYTLGATRSCFLENGDDVRSDDNPSAEAAGGWLRINYSDYSVFVGFAASDVEAKRLKSKLIDDAFFPFEKVDVVQHENVVYSSNRPTLPKDMRQKIEACLE